MTEEPTETAIAPAQPCLRLDFAQSASFLQPDEAGLLRDALQAMHDPAAARLAMQIDVAVTTLLAAPLHAGTRSVRVAKDERRTLHEAVLMLEQAPSDRFGKLRVELSAGD